MCTTGAIALWTTGNTQGTHYLLNINSGSCVAHNNWTILPMPMEVVHARFVRGKLFLTKMAISSMTTARKKPKSQKLQEWTDMKPQMTASLEIKTTTAITTQATKPHMMTSLAITTTTPITTLVITTLAITAMQALPSGTTGVNTPTDVDPTETRVILIISR